MRIAEQVAGKVWRKRGKWHHTVVASETTEGEMPEWTRKIGYDFPKTTVVWLSNGDFHDLQDEWDATKRYLLDNYAKDKTYFNTYAENCLRDGESVIAWADSIQSRDLTNVSDSEIADLFRQLMRRSIAYFPYMFSLHPIDEYLTERFDELLHDYARKEGLTKADFFEYQTALTLPMKKIFVLEEKYALMRLATDVKELRTGIHSLELNSRLVEHAAKYAWINSHLLEKEPYAVEEYRERISEMIKADVISELAQMTGEELRSRELQKKYMSKIAKYTELTEVTALVQQYGFLRSFRVDVPYLAYGRCDNLIREIMRRMNVSWTDITYLDSNEVHAFITRRDDSYRTLIKERRKGFVSVLLGGKRYELTGKDMQEVQAVVKLPEIVASDFVKGQTAYPGKIRGSAKVLHSINDIKKVGRGDILVISMTDPNYIPAMERAGAFVTDQGGILCHAAIISREMKKPCVIGTKIATKMFKDDQILEVDADDGIVSIVSA